MSDRRRLPVLQNRPASDGGDGEDPPREPWHWVGFGTVAIFAAWLPLAYAGSAISARWISSRWGIAASEGTIADDVRAMDALDRARMMAIVGLPTLAGLALAAFGGGFLVGRFGQNTGVKQAALSGVVTAAMASILAWQGASMASLFATVVLLAVASGFAAWGGKVGVRLRS